jgi:hypothetical protein
LGAWILKIAVKLQRFRFDIEDQFAHDPRLIKAGGV